MGDLRNKVCKQLQDTVMDFCERTYLGVSENELEVDGIICISFANSFEQHVVKIHKILKSHGLNDNDNSSTGLSDNHSDASYLTRCPKVTGNSKHIQNIERLHKDVGNPSSVMSYSGTVSKVIKSNIDHRSNTSCNKPTRNTDRSPTAAYNTKKNIENPAEENGFRLSSSEVSGVDNENMSVTELLSACDTGNLQSIGSEQKNYVESLEGGCVIVKMEPVDSSDDNLDQQDKMDNSISPDEIVPPDVGNDGITANPNTSDFIMEDNENNEMYLVSQYNCDPTSDHSQILSTGASEQKTNTDSRGKLPLKMGVVWKNEHAPYNHGDASDIHFPENALYQPGQGSKPRYQGYINLQNNSRRASDTYPDFRISSSSSNVPSMMESSDIMDQITNIMGNQCSSQKFVSLSHTKYNSLKGRKSNPSFFPKNLPTKRKFSLGEKGHNSSENKLHLSPSSMFKVSGANMSRAEQNATNNTGQRERAYFCRSCGKGFTMKCTRTRHEKTICGAGGSNVYKCEFCEKVFNRSDSRGRHMFKTHGIKSVTVY